MKILLPHSESKNEGGEDPWEEVIENDQTSISKARLELAKVLAKNKITNPEGSLESQAKSTNLNENLLTGLTLPSYQRYDGVVYRHLNYYSLPKGFQPIAVEDIYVISPLGGVEAFDEMLPNYKFKFSSQIPSLGNPLKFWIAYYKENENILDKSIKYISLLPKEHAKILPYLGIKTLNVEFMGRGHESKKDKGLLARALILSQDRELDLGLLCNKYKYKIV